MQHYSQSNNWVVGVEGDLSWANKRGTSGNIAPFAVGWTNTTKEKWLGTGRVRVGVTPVDRWLVYVTGGFTVAGVEATVDTQGFGVFSDSNTRWGWTVGAGAEAAIDRNWSIKLEYLYVGLQDKDYFSPDIPFGFGTVATRSVTLNNNIVRVGLNYAFR